MVLSTPIDRRDAQGWPPAFCVGRRRLGIEIKVVIVIIIVIVTSAVGLAQEMHECTSTNDKSQNRHGSNQARAHDRSTLIGRSAKSGERNS